MSAKVLHQNSIDCELLTESTNGNRNLNPRINLTFSGTILPFKFQRNKFSIIPAIAMTINKSQGQMFNKISVLLTTPVFLIGQLYVAANKVGYFDSFKV